MYPDARLHANLTLFDYILKAFIMAVTIVVVAVPEGDYNDYFKRKNS